MKPKKPKKRAVQVIAESTDRPGYKIARSPLRPGAVRGGRSLSIRAVSLETILRTAREPERWIDPEYHKPTSKRPPKRRAT